MKRGRAAPLEPLMPHQVEGVRWMVARERPTDGTAPGGIVADPPGLGKTALVVGLVVAPDAPPGPTLVVVGTGVVSQWCDALLRFGGVAPFVFPPGKGASLPLPASFAGVVLATHGRFRSDAGPPEGLRGRPWGRLVVDEGHVVRNEATRTHRNMRAIRAAARWVLSATPVQNRLADLGALLAFVGSPGIDVGFALERLVLRRTYASEAPRNPRLAALPPVVRVDAAVELGPEERALYDRIEAAGRRYAEDGTHGYDRCRYMEAVLRLRQACTHPALLASAVDAACAACGERGGGDDDDEGGGGSSASATVRAIASADVSAAVESFVGRTSAKLDWLAADVRAHLADAKSLVFCDWLAEMRLVADALEGVAPHVGAFHGSLDASERDEAVRGFEAAPPGAVLVMQVACGAVGLNLQAATRVYIMSPQWNPCTEMQAVARAHRLGQTREVTCVRLIARDSIDERCLGVQARKLALIESVMEGGVRGKGRGDGDDGAGAGLTREELEEVLG